MLSCRIIGCCSRSVSSERQKKQKKDGLPMLEKQSSSKVIPGTIRENSWNCGRYSRFPSAEAFWFPPSNSKSVSSFSVTLALSAPSRLQSTSSSFRRKSRISGGRCRESWFSGVPAPIRLFGFSTGAQMCWLIRFLLWYTAPSARLSTSTS